MQRPPVGVKMVIESVCIMKGIKPKKVAGEKVLYLLLIQQSEGTKNISDRKLTVFGIVTVGSCPGMGANTGIPPVAIVTESVYPAYGVFTRIRI